MQRLLGPIMQNAYLVTNLDAAIAHWTGVMGVGPFFLFEHIPFRELRFRGQPAGPVDLTVAIAYWGEVQIELVRQHDPTPSIYTEFAAARGTGLHHVGVLTESVERDLARWAGRGVRPVQEGRAAGMRFAYLATDHHPGGMVELIESTPATTGFFARMHAAAREWDGRDPIRRP